MMNEPTITVSGNVTRDPERKTGRSGRDFTVVPIAVNRRRFDKAQEAWVNGETTFVDLLCFGRVGPTALASFRKGQPVIAHGRVSLREWSTGTAHGSRVCVDVDSIGHDVSMGVSDFSRGAVPYDEDRAADHVPAAPEGTAGDLTTVLQERTRPAATASTDSDPDHIEDGDLESADLHDGDIDSADLDGGDIEVDADGVVVDASADRVLARSA